MLFYFLKNQESDISGDRMGRPKVKNKKNIFETIVNNNFRSKFVLDKLTILSLTENDHENDI